MAVLDGLNVATGDMAHVPWLNLAALMSVGAYLWWVASAGMGLGAVWWGMTVFYSVRVGLNAAHFCAGREGNVFGVA